MFRCAIDHIAVTAASLDEGAALVAQSLGVTLHPGGEHERMGTHNRLLRLGDSTYLEVIAPNPHAPKPSRPRWFDLDNPDSTSHPRLATWVARTSNIQAARAAASEPLGQIEPMSRGTLNWLITIPPDGRLPLGGVAPTLIQWHVPVHPASALPEAGCSLLQLELYHPDPAQVTALLDSLGLTHAARVYATPEHPFLTAHISTPNGVRVLGPPTPPT